MFKQTHALSARTSPASVDTQSVVAFPIETFRTYNERGSETWSGETAIDSIGVDPFDFVEILFEIADRHGVDLGYDADIEFPAPTTINALADHIVQVAGRTLAA